MTNVTAEKKILIFFAMVFHTYITKSKVPMVFAAIMMFLLHAILTLQLFHCTYITVTKVLSLKMEHMNRKMAHGSNQKTRSLQEKESTLTFKVRTFKLSETCCGRNLNGPKSLKLQTFRKNYTSPVLCNIEIRTKNIMKDNKIFYTYTKEQILQMKIFCDYFVMKCKISSLLYTCIF
jgi:hypothetical protein